MWVQFLAQKNATCSGATKSMLHNCWTVLWCPGVTAAKPTQPRAHAPQQKKTLQWEAQHPTWPQYSSPCWPELEKKVCTATKTQHQFSSVAQACPTLCDPMNRSTPGLPVHHKLPKFTQTHAHWVGDAIQPSHPLLSSSPPAPNPSQHQGPFQWVSSSHEVAKVLEFQLQHQSFQWTTRTDLLQDGLVGFPYSPRDSQESSPTPQFKSINSSALSFFYHRTLTSIHDHWKNHSLDQTDLCWQSNVSAF